MTDRALTKALRGQWHGNYGTARCPAHDDRNPSLSITERDGKLLVHCHAGCDQGAVWDALKGMGLVGQDDYLKPVPRRTDSRGPLPAPPATATKGPDTKDRTEVARRIWSASQPAAGTPVETYLASRGITIEPPPTLRYHPGLKHGPTGLPLPAMVTAVTTWPEREVIAIHRTFLTADGSKKAQVSNPKLMLGPCAGGAVRLSPFGNDLVLAEGIETALSVLQASGKPVWACLSTSGLKSVLLPPEVATVTIAADGDEPGITAAEEAASRFYREGRDVKIAKPPPGMDFNDLLLLPANVVPLRRRQVRYG